MFRSLLVKLCGKRVPALDDDLSQTDSILLNPVGDAIGDAIVHSLHLRQLKQAYPNARTAVFVTNRNRAIFEAAGAVDELIDMKPLNYFRNRGKWDLYLDFTTRFNSRSLVLDKILRPKRVMIFVKTPKKHYSLDNIHTHDFYQPLPEKIHFRDYLKYSALAPYLASQELFYQLALPDNVKNTIQGFWQPNKLRILLCPQGSNRKRQLPAGECGQILSKIEPHFAQYLDIQLGYSKSNENYLSELNMVFPTPSVRLSKPTSLLEYLALVDSADIVLAVDSGAVHIACAFEKALLAFYADFPENVAKWYPHTRNKENTLMLLGRQNPATSDDTQGFDLHCAADWLNRQIANRLEEKKLKP